MPVAEIDALEIRWFERGELPRSVSEWGGRIALPDGVSDPEYEERTDIYLSTGGAPHLSVKLSRGSLEVKQRLDVEEFDDAATGTFGRSENWHKWSWKYAAAGGMADPVRDALAAKNASEWVEVPKRRWKWKFRVSEQAVAPVPFSDRPPCGCAFELVALDTTGDPWWSFAIDIFAPLKERRATLRRAVRAIPAGFPGARARENSFSYGEWLVRRAAGRR